MKTISFRKVILSVALFALICFGMIDSEKLASSSSFKSNYQMMDLVSRAIKNRTKTSSTAKHAPLTPLQKNTPAPFAKKSKETPNQPILYQGWVKYIHYNVASGSKPKTFFKNDFFTKQSPKQKAQAPDKNGISMAIPSEKHFYAVVYQDNINFLTSRELSKVWDTLHIDFIKTIPNNDRFKGGVKDDGQYIEGSCFEIQTKIPKMEIDELWLICMKDEEKTKMMNAIIKLKVKKQEAAGVNYTATAKQLGPFSGKYTINTIQDELKGIVSDINDPKRSPLDGYWIVLQDWSQCTLKCGGGKQYRQLLCIPPKAGGKPCAGKEIRHRPCNTQPCLTTNKKETLVIKDALTGSKSQTQGDMPSMTKAVLKTLPISRRPQRYDKCFIKESDALMLNIGRDTVGTTPPAKVLIRLVMNNKSIVAYQDDFLSAAYKTFLLEQTEFITLEKNKTCFILKGINDNAQFCQLNSDGSDFVKEWRDDFKLFKEDCKQNRTTLADDEQSRITKEYLDRVEQLKQEFLQMKAQKVKNINEKSEEMTLQRKIDQAHQLSIVAIQKELKLEKLIENEERQRELEQQEELKLHMEAEKKKTDCLVKSIKEKQIEEMFNLNKQKVEAEIERIKEETRQRILKKRNEIKNKIKLMRRKNERKLSLLKNDIMSMKTETAGNLQQLSQMGSADKCFLPNGTNEEGIIKYCTEHFSDNFSKFIECKQNETFCYVCCETEFGSLHIPQREDCYITKCEKKETKSEIARQIESASKKLDSIMK